VVQTYGVHSLDSYALGFTIATFAGFVLDFGTGTWVTRQVALGGPAPMFVLARLPVLAIGCIAAATIALAGLASGPEALAVVVMGVAVAVSLLGQGFFWGLMMHDREMYFAIAESVLVVTFLAANHFAILPGNQPLMYTAAAYAVGAAGRSIVLLRHRRLDFGRGNVADWWTQMRSYGMQGLVTIAAAQLDTILLAGLLVGNATGAVAAYALAMRVYYAAPMPLQALAAALLPRFVTQPRRHLRVALLGTILGSLAACGAAVAFLLIAPVFGYGNPVVSQLRTVMGILAIAFLARCATYVLGAFVTAQGGQRSRLWSSTAALGTMITLDLLLIPPFGVKGAAIAMVVADWTLLAGYLLAFIHIIRVRHQPMAPVGQAAI
jgi:O-antigen/teichoic acid export membrane protein